MPERVIYHFMCPVHPEEELYTEDPAITMLFIPEKPAECPKCQKYYYKGECRVREEKK